MERGCHYDSVPKSPRTPLARDSPANTEAARERLAMLLLPRGCLGDNQPSWCEEISNVLMLPGSQPWTLALVEGKMRQLLQVFLSFVGDHMCV